MLKIQCVNDMTWRDFFQAIQMPQRTNPPKTRATLKRQILNNGFGAHGWRVGGVARAINGD